MAHASWPRQKLCYVSTSQKEGRITLREAVVQGAGCLSTHRRQHMLEEQIKPAGAVVPVLQIKRV